MGKDNNKEKQDPKQDPGTVNESNDSNKEGATDGQKDPGADVVTMPKGAAMCPVTKQLHVPIYNVERVDGSKEKACIMCLGAAHTYKSFSQIQYKK